MSSPLLEPKSEISTYFRCDNCGILLDEVSWQRCNLCKGFDLCYRCAALSHDHLERQTLVDHQKVHENRPITGDCFGLVSIEEADAEGLQARLKTRQREYERILDKKKIENDYDMDIVLGQLAQKPPSLDDDVNSLIIKYHLESKKRNINVLSLDGGGIRGYMPIKILGELITQKYLPEIDKLDPNDFQQKQSFHEAQSEFIKRFDYFVGTSTGGLIAFCLAINYNILDMMDIYSNAGHYFKKNYLGPFFCSKYDPSMIHKKIDDLIDQIVLPSGERLSSKHATLLDIRNLLNPDHIIDEEKAKLAIYTYGNYLEFVDNYNSVDTPDSIDLENHLYRVQREKVLLITSYNITKNVVTIFNTSYAEHWGYRIADVLKATMAAPIYFPPYKVYQGTQINGRFLPGKTVEMFVDGGVFANDPELAALWAIRMQWKKLVNYHLLCVGTGYYTSTLLPSTWGGYFTWVFNGGFLVSTLLSATRSFTEVIGDNLAKFHNIRRMKLNFQINKAMDIDDPEFIRIFDREWVHLKYGPDFKAFVYFYKKYITEEI